MKVVIGKYNLEIEDVINIEYDEFNMKIIFHIKDGTTRQIDCSKRSISFNVLI